MASCVFDAILALSVFVANLFGIPVTGFFVLYFLELPGSPGKGHGSERSRTRRHRWNFPGPDHGAKRMAGEAVHSPGKVCTWLKEDILISRHYFKVFSE